MKQQQQVDQEALVSTVQTLLQQLKQPTTKIDQRQPTWVDRHLGAPKSFPEIIWRLSWLVVVPAIAAFIALPIGVWCWVNGLPMAVILAAVALGGGYYTAYWFAANSARDRKLERLIDLQLSIPPLIMAAVFLWEGLKYGG